MGVDASMIIFHLKGFTMFEDDDRQEMDKQEEEMGPRTVITVSFIPKDTDPVRLLRVIDDVTDAVADRMTNLEIGMSTNVPDETYAMVANDKWVKEWASERQVENTDIVLHMRSLVASQLILARSMMLGDQGWEQEWNKLSQEERDAIHEKNRLRAEHYEKEAIDSAVELRTHQIRQAFDIANQWATEPDLTPMERCHGVAHDLYALYGVDQKPINIGPLENYVPDSIQKAYPISAGKAYAQHYDTHLSEQIRQNQIRAAKDLFGD
jgi:hypothetical protein